jgi:hypothetical protein
VGIAQLHSARMVNGGFPERRGYGFGMVDAPKRCIFVAKIAINRKFTPNRINRIFREFSAI